MIFQHTWRLVLSGEKTQTRRVAKPKETSNYPMYEPVLQCVYHNSPRALINEV